MANYTDINSTEINTLLVNENTFVPDMSKSFAAVTEDGILPSEEVAGMNVNAVFAELKAKKDYNNKRCSFKGVLDFLSNNYLDDIEVGGVKYPCVECAFQAMRCSKASDRVFFETVLGFEAAKLGKYIPARSNWEDIQDNIMLKLLRKKFSKTELAIKLLNTGDLQLCHWNYWNDTYWGKCKVLKKEERENCTTEYYVEEGQNILGKLLVQVREEIKTSGEYIEFMDENGYYHDAPLNAYKYSREHENK